jgi:hypothetical protein
MGLTRTRGLRDGESVWALYRQPRILGVRLRRSTRADVVVVGAGGQRSVPLARGLRSQGWWAAFPCGAALNDSNLRSMIDPDS